jgi:Sigma-70 region 2
MRQTDGDRRRRFNALFAAYSRDIVAYCGWRAASGSDAQDAVAEVFLAAWRRIERLPEGDAARVWLYAHDALCAVGLEQGAEAPARWVDELEAIAARRGIRELLLRATVYRARLGEPGAIEATARSLRRSTIRRSATCSSPPSSAQSPANV